MRLKPKLGVALAGGGARGLTHIGVLAALEQKNIPVAAIAGTSFGSVVGALYALDPNINNLKSRFSQLIETADLRSIGLALFQPKKTGKSLRFWESLFEYQTLSRSLFKKSIVDDKKVREAFRLIFGDATFGDLKIPFAAVALDLVTGADITFSAECSGPDCLVRDAVFASCALPAIFPPVTIGEKILVDGGVTENIPITEVQALGIDVVLAVFLGRERPSPPADLEKGYKILLRSDDLARHKLQKLLLGAADLVIRPEVGDLHWLDFNQFDLALGKGRAAVANNLPAIKTITSRRYLVKKRLRNFLARR
jgi:NTE family protein